MTDTFSPAAVVTLAVTQFNVGSCSPATVTLTTPIPGVTQSAPNAPIEVAVASGTSVRINFLVTDGSQPPQELKFMPLGIGFDAVGNVDPTGQTTFPTRTVAYVTTRTQLSIVDVVTANTNFQFVVFIQNLADGSVGYIDPMFTNKTT